MSCIDRNNQENINKEEGEEELIDKKSKSIFSFLSYNNLDGISPVIQWCVSNMKKLTNFEILQFYVLLNGLTNT